MASCSFARSATTILQRTLVPFPVPGTLAAGAVALLPTAPTEARPVVPGGSRNRDRDLVESGRDIFFNEAFSGNGRNCGTCHRAANNFAIDTAFIAALPGDDPLFVVEFVPAWRENFATPELMRKLARNVPGDGTATQSTG